MKKTWFLVESAVVVRVLLTAVIIIASISILAISAIFVYGTVAVKHYETTNIEDYGEYKGNYDNKTVTKFITSFFPKEIEPTFENVKYVYRAKKLDAYAFEAWLEFTIQDEDAFQTYVDTVTKGEHLQTFAYDNTYSEYVIADSFELHPNAQNDEDPSDGYSIQYAMIGKILINDEKNEIIHIALGVYDGGGVRTNFLREYFTRFNIDPIQYNQDRGRFSVLTVARDYGILKQGDTICQEKHVRNRKAEFIM